MAYRRQATVTAIGNENIGIMQNGINLKNNLSSRNRTKQPLSNLHNIIHNQKNLGETVEKKKNNFAQTKAQDQLDQKENCKIFEDSFEDVCSYQPSNQNLEAKWFEEQVADLDMFDKPRTKPITKAELDWVEYYEFGEKNNDLFKDFEDHNPIDEIFDYPDVPVLSHFIDIEHIETPIPPSDLFDDLDLSNIDELVLPDISALTFEEPTPLIASEFDDMNFLNDSLER